MAGPDSPAVDDIGDRVIAAGQTTETLDERRREAAIHARLFGAATPVHIGRYRVRARLGAGAMGTVFAAHDERLDRPVAIKVLTDRSAAGQALTLREARGLARLTHPNVVRIYEADTDDDRVFIVMESLQGETLASWPTGRGAREILGAYLAAGRGLAAVHAAGLVHRDFKPTNVMIDGYGHARLIDFGLARRVGSPATAPAASPAMSMTATMTGALVGTPAYMAPELLTGQPATPRSDQFAFCTALYESLLAERPFQGDSIPDLQAQMTDGVPTQINQLPSRVAGAIARGLAVDPADRWPDMPALLAALEQAGRRARWPLIVGAALVLAGALAWVLWPAAAVDPGPATATVAPPPDARALPDAPALAAAVLAARDADEAWRDAAQATLARPIQREIARFDAAPIELVTLNTDRPDRPAFAARMPDQMWRRWPGDAQPTPLADLVRGCHAASLAMNTDDVRDTPVCHLGGRLAPTDGVWRYTTAAGEVGKPLAVPPGSSFWAADASLITLTDGQLARQPLSGDEAPSRPGELHDIVTLAREDGVALVARSDGEVFVWQPKQAPWSLGRVQGVSRLLIAPRGRWFAILAGGRLQIRESASSAPIHLPGGWRANLAFDPSGRWLAGVSSEGELIVWDLRTRRATRLSASSPSAIEWCAAGLLAGLRDGRVLRFNLDALTGQRLGAHAANVWSGAMAPDRRSWVTAGMDRVAQIWSPTRPPITLRGHTRGIFTAAFSPDGRHVATGSSDGTARLWPVDGGAPIVFPGHEIWAYALAFSPDGQHLATVSKAGVVRQWPIAGGAPRVLAEAGDPKSMRRSHAAAYAPDGRWLAVGIKSGRVRLLSTQGEPPRELPTHGYDAQLFYDAQGRLVTYGNDPEIRVFRPDGATLRATVRSPKPVRAVTSAPGMLAWSTSAGDVWVKPEQAPARRLGRLDGQLEMLAFDADAARLIVGSSSGQLALWRVSDGHQTDLPGHLDAVRFVGFDAQGDAVSAGADGQVRRWALAHDEAGLRARLRAASDVCLDAAQRARWLTADEATRLRCTQRKRP